KRVRVGGRNRQQRGNNVIVARVRVIDGDGTRATRANVLRGVENDVQRGEVAGGDVEQGRRDRRFRALLDLQRVGPNRSAVQIEGGEDLAGIYEINRGRVGGDHGAAQNQGRRRRHTAGGRCEVTAVDLDGRIAGIAGGVVRDRGNRQSRALGGGD